MIIEVGVYTQAFAVSSGSIKFYITLDYAHYTSERFGEGTGPIFMDYINCTGSDSWRKCSNFTHYYGCSHSDDVGVKCQPGL